MRNPNIILFVAQALCGRASGAKRWPRGQKRSNSGERGAGGGAAAEGAPVHGVFAELC